MCTLETFNIDRKKALTAFKDYISKYDLNNINITLKIAHTYRVAALSERIAGNNCVDLAWLLGLLHDIGRFEQVTKYGTFKDSLSVDHAEFGADILFNDGLIKNFLSENFLNSNELMQLIETAVRLHNKFRLPENLCEPTLTYTKILRDSDKLDIFRVITEPPYNYDDKRDLDGLTVRDEVIQSVIEHRCVPRPENANQFNELEMLISQCCMAFELEFKESRKIAIEQGYLRKILNQDNEFLIMLRSEIAKAWSKTLIC